MSPSGKRLSKDTFSSRTFLKLVRENRRPAALDERFSDDRSNEVASTIDRLQHIATVGDTWVGGKTRMYWLLRGMLRARQIENVEGVLVDQIIENANGIILQETSTSERITPKMIGGLIKGGTLLKVQQAKLQTPILAYDLNSDRVFVVDSWTLFTLRRQRESISRALKEAV